jgi:hypothetical protein
MRIEKMVASRQWWDFEEIRRKMEFSDYSISSVFWKSSFYTFYTSLLNMMGNPRL